MSKEVYVVIGAVIGLIAAIVFAPPSLFGVNFPFPDGFVLDSDWADRTFASGDVRHANAAITSFYVKAAVAAVVGGVLGYFVAQRSEKSS